MPKKPMPKKPLTLTEQRLVDTITRLRRQGEIVRFDDLRQALHGLGEFVGDRDLDRLLQRLSRAGVIKHVRKIEPSGKVNKVYGWIIVKRK